MSYQNWSEEFEPVKITLKQDEFVCKKIDKQFKDKMLERCSGKLKKLQKQKEDCAWNTFDTSESEEYDIEIVFYKKLLALMESMETLEKKGE